MDKRSAYEKKSFKIAAPIIVWHTDNPTFPPHWHDCFEMLYIAKGGVQVSLDDVTYEACGVDSRRGGEGGDNGGIILVNSGIIHSFFNVRPGSAVSGLQFSITFFDESFINLRDIVFQNPVIGNNSMSGVHYDRVCRLLREVFQEHREKTIGYQLAVKSKLYELMLIILREMPKTEPKISPAKSKYICDYITKNFDNPDLTLEKAAGTFNLSKFYFSHFFKKTTGYTFYDYLTATRINFAKQYLTETNMTITDAAFRSGFNTLQTFNRVFKTLTGFTPGNYRRENSIVTPKTTDRRD